MKANRLKKTKTIRLQLKMFTLDIHKLKHREMLKVKEWKKIYEANLTK